MGSLPIKNPGFSPSRPGSLREKRLNAQSKNVSSGNQREDSSSRGPLRSVSLGGHRRLPGTSGDGRRRPGSRRSTQRPHCIPPLRPGPPGARLAAHAALATRCAGLGSNRCCWFSLNSPGDLLSHLHPGLVLIGWMRSGAAGTGPGPATPPTAPPAAASHAPRGVATLHASRPGGGGVGGGFAREPPLPPRFLSGETALGGAATRCFVRKRIPASWTARFITAVGLTLLDLGVGALGELGVGAGALGEPAGPPLTAADVTQETSTSPFYRGVPSQPGAHHGGCPREALAPTPSPPTPPLPRGLAWAFPSPPPPVGRLQFRGSGAPLEGADSAWPSHSCGGSEASARRHRCGSRPSGAPSRPGLCVGGRLLLPAGLGLPEALPPGGRGAGAGPLPSAPPALPPPPPRPQAQLPSPQRLRQAPRGCDSAGTAAPRRGPLALSSGTLATGHGGTPPKGLPAHCREALGRHRPEPRGAASSGSGLAIASWRPRADVPPRVPMGQGRKDRPPGGNAPARGGGGANGLPKPGSDQGCLPLAHMCLGPLAPPRGCRSFAVLPAVPLQYIQ
ncbi:unnamed protein product [Nyctereutes procyonoides]|uniref:(raccoon dog) hypothetical protein n=1 Tax=Nyctereutes procyonoides TaxID=34880 RepID=A0A811Z4B5_NYCPR|nr:unnamed protein product [Nyctereutes procyonoides]